MEKKECVLIKELLPIYCDDAVSEESRAIIEDHLETCSECDDFKNEIIEMKKEEMEVDKKIEETKTEYASEVSKKLRRHKKKVDTISMIAIVALWVVFMYCFQVVEVSGISMQPTFQDGDRLLMNRVIYHITEPKRGDVVMVNLEDMSILKRVVAVPGETIDIKDHAIFIDGKQIEIEEEEGTILPGELTYPITLGEDEYFVMGDNVEVSLDSRSSEVGVVERDEIRTKYACRFFKFK